MPLTREQVLDEALRLSDEKGLDGLSLRALAGRLGVQAPTLYWHVANKAALLDALSDAIMDEALAALPERTEPGTKPGTKPGTEPWQEWLLGTFVALRKAMLRHRDGARIVSGAHDSLRRAEFTEIVLRRLAAAGLDGQRAWLLAMAGTRYTLGHVLAEQGPDAAPAPHLRAEFERRFPLVAQGVSGYFETHSADDLYEDGLRLLFAMPPHDPAS
jgi:TetR/AcrR family tetracycline transcriptional repressor